VEETRTIWQQRVAEEREKNCQSDGKSIKSGASMTTHGEAVKKVKKRGKIENVIISCFHSKLPQHIGRKKRENIDKR
jgi:hypothetical protein